MLACNFISFFLHQLGLLGRDIFATCQKVIDDFHDKMIEDMNIKYRPVKGDDQQRGIFIRKLVSRGVDIVRTNFLRNCDRKRKKLEAMHRGVKKPNNILSECKDIGGVGAGTTETEDSHDTNDQNTEKEKSTRGSQQGYTKNIDHSKKNDSESFDDNRVDQSSSSRYQIYRRDSEITKLIKDAAVTSRSKTSTDTSKEEHVKVSAQISMNRHEGQPEMTEHNNPSLEHNINDGNENDNYNHKPISVRELQARNRKSKPMYFHYGMILTKFCARKISIHDITLEMVHHLLNRENELYSDFTMTSATDLQKEIVLQSINAIKTFFRLRGLDKTTKTIIEDYNKRFLKPGAKRAKTLNDIVHREEEDIDKVSKQQILPNNRHLMAFVY